MAEQVVKLRLDTRGFDRGINRATAALGALASIATVKTVADLADRFQQVNARLKLVTGSSAEFTRAQRALNAVAASTRSSLEETTDLFSRLARSTADTAISQEQLLTATTAINQAIKVSGASAQEANAAIIQLGQGLASGALRGDELRSVLEQTPRLAQAIAAGLGVSIGELRKLGTEGALTTQVVLDALQNQAPLIAQEFAQIPPTISDAFTALSNNVLQATEVLNQAGFGSVLSGIAQGIGDSVNAIQATFREILPQQDLAALQQRVRVAFLDIVIAIVGAIDRVEPVIGYLFQLVRDGINNLIRFANQLPPEAQLLGLIGFFLVGRGVRLIVLAVAAFFDEIKGFMDRAVKYFENKINSMIDIYNSIVTAIGAEPLDRVIFGDNAFSDAVGVANDAFVAFIDSSTQALKEIGNESSVTTVKVSALGKMLEKLQAQRDAVNAPAAMDPTGMFPQIATQPSGTVALPESADKLAKQQEQLQRQFTQLQDSLLSETEAEQQAFQNRLAILDEYYGSRRAFDQNYAKLREGLEIKHQARMDQIQKANYEKQLNSFKAGKFAEMDFSKFSEKEKTKFIIEGGREALNALGQHSKEAFQLAKAAAMAEAVINTAQGVTKALAQGGIFGPLLAGVIIAAGAAQIATIASQNYTGRQFGGYVQGGKPYTVGEAGPETFVPAGSGQIVPNRGSMGESNVVNINFEINAVDSQGVDQIILQRKALITNIVREGMENQGRRSVV